MPLYRSPYPANVSRDAIRQSGNRHMPQDIHLLARQEFLTDKAKYFSDKKELYLEVKDRIAESLGLPLSMIRVCGSAYWGRSYTADRDFLPGDSDLDVALIDQLMYVRAISEARQMTHNFYNRTLFPSSPHNAYETFRDYAYKKGIIRPDLMPRTRLKTLLSSLSHSLSYQFRDHFSKITFAIYDTEASFTVKQIAPTEKFNGGKV
ncbi:hypothetical protein [Pleomorphomonas sp. PLEO]|uniref:hypothetical protein n=1 Tax=Pleomorphomonas sp. PLEO TaxID=3239306 RepID=UPI00351DAA29